MAITAGQRWIFGKSRDARDGEVPPSWATWELHLHNGRVWLSDFYDIAAWPQENVVKAVFLSSGAAWLPHQSIGSIYHPDGTVERFYFWSPGWFSVLVHDKLTERQGGGPYRNASYWKAPE